MNVKSRTVEADATTADTLEMWARERGLSLSEFLAEFASLAASPPGFGEMRRAGTGPWAPEILAEDARRLAEFERTGVGVPWEEVEAWMESRGTSGERPRPSRPLRSRIWREGVWERGP